MLLLANPFFAAKPVGGEPTSGDPGLAATTPETRAEVLYRACPKDTARRLAYLEGHILDNAPYATWWWRTWMGVYVGGMAFEGVRAGLTDERDRRAAAVANAAKSTIGLARALTSRPTAMADVDGLELAPPDAEACRERLADAEERLRTSAEEAHDERFGWVSHLGNLALNAGAAVAVAELYDYDAAYWRGAMGFAIGEVRIFSFPWQAEDDWKKYETRFGDRTLDESETTWLLQPTLNGARLVVRF